MRISDLSRAAGASIPTIKYYQREGLLPPGQRSSPNQAEYGELHLRRLRLIRALREEGDLSIDQIRRLVAAVESEEPLFEVIGEATRALLGRGDGADRPANAADTAAVRHLLDRLGWKVHTPQTTERLAATLATFREVCFPDAPPELFEGYARAVEELARWEIAFTGSRATGEGGREAAVETAVAGSVLGGELLLAFRRAAHEHFARLLWGTTRAPSL